MLSYKMDFSSCNIMPGFGKSSHILPVKYLRVHPNASNTSLLFVSGASTTVSLPLGYLAGYSIIKGHHSIRVY